MSCWDTVPDDVGSVKKGTCRGGADRSYRVTVLERMHEVERTQRKGVHFYLETWVMKGLTEEVALSQSRRTRGCLIYVRGRVG